MPRTHASLVLALAAGPWFGFAANAQSDFEQRLAKHAFFSKIEYRRSDLYAPFVFYLQRPPKEDPHHERAVTSKFVPFLREAEQVFVEQYVEPLGLKRRDGHPPYRIAILASRGDYDNFARSIRSYGLHRALAHYDPEVRLAVTYEAHFAPDGRTRERRQSLVHEFVHAMQHAYSSGPHGLPRPIWFNEGLAEYRSNCSNMASSLRRPRFPADSAAGGMLAAIGDPRATPLRELVTFEGPGYLPVIQAGRKRAGRVDDNEFDHAVLSTFYAQATLLVYYLHHGEDGRFRSSFNDYMGRVMRGESGWAPFEASFSPVADVERGFRQWCADACGEHFGIDVTNQTAMASFEPDAPRRVAFDFGRLALDGSQWKTRLAAVLETARRGDYEAATELAGSIEAPSEAAARRIARERVRLEALRSFRHEFLDNARRSGWMLDLGRKGKVQEIRAGTVHLLFGRTGEFEIPLAEISHAMLVREAGKRDQFEGDNAWIGAYLNLLDGGSQRAVERSLGHGALAEELRADLPSLRSLRAEGPAAAAWVALAEGGAPGDTAAAETSFQTLRTLILEHGSTSLVSGSNDVLRDLAKYLLDRAFAPTDAKSLGLRGTLTTLADGRMRIHHTFAGDEQDLVFEPRDDPFADQRRLLPPVTAPRAPGFAIVDGRLEGIGATYGRYPLPLKAPLTLRFKASATQGMIVAKFGLCDDGFGNRIDTHWFGTLDVLDQAGNIFGSIEARPITMREGQTYEHEIVHDGTSVTRKINGEVVAKADRIGTRTSGWLDLWVHSNGPIRFESIEIEASLDQARIGDLKAGWVDERLGDLFGSK